MTDPTPSASTPKTTGAPPNDGLPKARREYRRFLSPLFRQLLKYSDWPILVGPWRGEVAIEALYWIPWLHQLFHELTIPRTRVFPISRGGAAHWYGCPQGLELYAMRSVKEIRIQNKLQQARTGLLKQTHQSDFDRAVLRDAAQTLGFGRRYLTIHPAWMYQALAPFWLGVRGLSWLQTQVRFEPMPVPVLPQELDTKLPKEYVAVRFYWRTTFPARQETAEFCRAALARLTETHPVVLVNSGLFVDDHGDYMPKKLPANVLHLPDLLGNPVPETNLGIQSTVILKSMGMLGTYGGTTQLAGRLGRPAVGVYTDWQGTALPHRHLSEALALHQGVPFNVIRVGDLPMLQECLPPIDIARSQPAMTA